jgi:hypothetical protein
LTRNPILTPVSARSQSRRDSPVSVAWSFLSPEINSTSHPLSVSSLDSISSPLTPPSHGLSIDFPAMKSNFSGSVSSISHGNYKDSLFDSSVSAEKSNVLESSHLHVRSEPDWICAPSQRQHTPLRSSQFPTYGMMPTAADFPHTLEANMAASDAITDDMSVSLNRTWSHDGLLPGVTSDPYADPAYHSPMASMSPSPYSFYSPDHGPWASMSQDFALRSSTVMPAQTVVDRRIAPAKADISIVSSPQSDFDEDCVFGYLSRRRHDYEEELDLSDLSSLPSVHRASARELETSVTGAKKHRGKTGRRKPKAVMSTQNYNGMPISVLPASKKQECNFQHPDGSICRQRFQRVEHLKRHRAIHTSAENHTCPDPECGKRFRARADNLREHFKTHLRETSCKRNTSRTFEQFYRFIRDMYGTEGEKSIAKLEKWRAVGGHKKSDNAAVRRPKDRP